MDLQYHVRKTWEDIDSQVGVNYNFLINAKKACDKLEGYSVFDSNGVKVYPEIIGFQIGDAVQLSEGAKTVNGTDIASKYIGEKLFVQSIKENGYGIGFSVNGLPLGTIVKDYVMPFSETFTPQIEPYYVAVATENTIIRMEPKSTANIVKTVSNNGFYKIVNEIDGWGKLEKGLGWINLADVQIIKHEKD